MMVQLLDAMKLAVIVERLIASTGIFEWRLFYLWRDLMSDYGGTFEEDFFSDTQVIHLELDILSDMWQALNAEILQNNWEVNEGLRFILAAGLAALRAERQREQVKNKPEADLIAELDRIQRQRMQIDGRYAVMKFRTYQFMQDAKTLAIKLNVCQMQLESLQQANEQLRKRLDEHLDAG
jgi:hypothetical protein